MILIMVGCSAPKIHQTEPTITSFQPAEALSADLSQVTEVHDEITTSTTEPDPGKSSTSTPVFELTGSTRICSPLEGISLEDIEAHIVNPYLPPRAGSDDPHQGIDLAILQTGTQIALKGTTVMAVLPGTVAAVIKDRFPYGNAVMVETTIGNTNLPASALPDLEAAVTPHPSLTCPASTDAENLLNPQTANGEEISLYLLYAHLENAPSLNTGDEVMCADSLGIVGDSGNALNPHLHLEARIGPAGARFTSLAHYHGSATLEEMALYCLWRVQGAFKTLDPMELLRQ